MAAVAVLGAGAWGTALGKVLAEKGNEVRLYARRSDLAAEINEARANVRYLPGIRVPDNMTATHDLERTLHGAELVVFVVPSHAMRETVKEAAPFLSKKAIAVSATKGIENGSLSFMDEILREGLDLPDDRLAFLSGPSFAKELALEQPTAVVVASRNQHTAHDVMHRFHTNYLRLYASDDVPGVECGGALKNVIAIATGAVDGLGLGANTRAALITRGLAEVARLSDARGGNVRTLAGLAGLGDLVLTCTGELSRNRTVGIELGKGRKLDDIVATLGHVAEGVKTAKSANDLADRLNVDMPITREIYRVLYEGKTVQAALAELMARELGPEF